ncbi:MAG: hypothetical protein OT477_14445 [Chloroflexi bacterium]|nr:hypothetical protein [Chloroflexota bacterium]
MFVQSGLGVNGLGAFGRFIHLALAVKIFAQSAYSRHHIHTGGSLLLAHLVGQCLFFRLLLLALLFLRHRLQLDVDFVEGNLGRVCAAVPPRGQRNAF